MPVVMGCNILLCLGSWVGNEASCAWQSRDLWIRQMESGNAAECGEFVSEDENDGVVDAIDVYRLC